MTAMIPAWMCALFSLGLFIIGYAIGAINGRVTEKVQLVCVLKSYKEAYDRLKDELDIDDLVREDR